VIVFAFGLGLLAGIALTVVLMRPRSEPATAAVATKAPDPPPVVREPPRPEAHPPEPAKPSARPRPEPKPEAAPPPGPAPVATAAPVVGTLRFESDVAGAQVFIDREFVGATPVTANVKPGTHRLNVSAQGYEGIADTIEVAAGPRDFMMKFKEVRLDVALDVVHKHRMGSCQGRLIATPQGLRYETANKNDTFSTGLLDLETFQVDYLKKILKAARNGKTYDFTDPAGNADHLFVFHRDIEKARERLRSGDTSARD